MRKISFYPFKNNISISFFDRKKNLIITYFISLSVRKQVKLKKNVMKKLLLLAGLLFAFFASAQAIQDWTADLPTLANYNNHTIATDSQGNVYSVNTYYGANGPVDFDPGPGVFTLSAISLNMYLLKVNAAGNFVWAKQIGGGSTLGSSTGTSITIDASDNIYISGSSNKIIASGTFDFDPGTGVTNVINPTGHYVMYILKLDSEGNHIWNRQFNNPSNTQYDLDKMYQLKIDSAGNIYATGCYNGTVDFDPSEGVSNLTSNTNGNSTEIFILKLNNQGNLVWAKALPNSSTNTGLKNDRGISIDVDSSGNVYTTGFYWYSIDANPGAGINNLVAYTSSNPVIAGGNTQYISKLNSFGDYVWAYDLVGGHNDANLPALAIDGAGNIIISGDTFGNTGGLRDFDFGPGTYILPSDTGSFVFKINSNAGFIWAKSTARTIGVSGNSSNYGSGLILDSNGNIYTTGTFGNNVTADFDPSTATFLLTSAGNYDGYISKLDTNGNFLWANKIGGSGLEACYSIALSSSGKITVTGSTNSGFAKSAAVSTGGFLASYTQPVTPLGTADNEITKINLYPNPTDKNLNLKLSSNLEKANVKMYSVAGQMVLQKNNLSGKDFTFDVSNLATGIYVLQVSDGKSSYKSTFVKK